MMIGVGKLGLEGEVAPVGGWVGGWLDDLVCLMVAGIKSEWVGGWVGWKMVSLLD